MFVWIFFLAACFLLGGASLGQRLGRRRIVMVLFCLVVGASFASYRVIQ